MASRKLQVEIVGDASSLKRAFGDASNSTSRFGKGLGKLAKVAAVGVGAAFAGLAVVVKKGMDEIGDSQKVAAQTAATLKSTGGIANVTADHVAKLSQSLSNMSSVDDELVQTGANLLLTFKNVRNEVGAGNAVFDRATRSALDLSQAGFGSVESASKMLGKALNDPVKGMTALGRAGVTFSEGQKEAIKDLVKTGDTLGAQKLILKEIESQVGGSAKAYGETLPGQLAKARNSFDEMAAQVALKFLPALTGVLSWVNAHWPEISAVMTTVADAVIKAVQGIAVVVGWLAGQWNTHRATIMAVWTGIQQSVQEFVTWFRGSFLPAVQNVVAVVMALWDRFGDHITLVIRTAFTIVRTFIATTLGNISSVVNAFLAILRGDWSEAWNEIKEIPGRTLRAAATIIRGLVGVFLSAAKVIGKAVLDGLMSVLSTIAGKVTAELGRVKAAVIGAFAGAAMWLFNAGASIVQGVIDGITSKLGPLADAVGALKNAVKSVVPGWGSTPGEWAAYAIGEPIVLGVIKGMERHLTSLKGKAREMADTVVKTTTDTLRNKQGEFEDAWSGYASAALAAFDKIAGQVQTKSEKALEAMRTAREKADIAGSVTEARTGLATAVAGGDPAAIVQAQKTLDDALYRQKEYGLEQRAMLERTKLNEQTELSRTKFEEWLATRTVQQQQEIAKEGKGQSEILKKIKSYNPAYRQRGVEIGENLAEGLLDARGKVVDAANELAAAVAKAMGVAIDIRRDTVGNIEARRDQIIGRIPGLASGGIVNRPTLALIGESGPEAVVPLRGSEMVGATVMNFSFPNYVGAKDELIRTVRAGLAEVARDNPNIFAGKA